MDYFCINVSVDFNIFLFLLERLFLDEIYFRLVLLFFRSMYGGIFLDHVYDYFVLLFLYVVQSLAAVIACLGLVAVASV